MPVLTKKGLRKKVILVLKKQGYDVNNGIFVLKNDTREVKRSAHNLARTERISNSEELITRNAGIIANHLINGVDLDVEKIDPEIIEVKPNTLHETIFRWWNLVWWSLPYERAYGRQVRLVVWDKYHNAPIGLIGLQSPILSWSVRDNFLGIEKADRDYWVNQSMSAQRLGALPPYNYVLGGKLVASLMTAQQVRKIFEKKYSGQKTVMENRELPARLLFITTTGAYGKSSIYNRLKFNDEKISEFIGYTKGSGSFHIPNNLYENFIKYLRQRNYDVRRGYGSGPSRKLRLIEQAMECLGIENGANHGIQRAVYLFPMAKNLTNVIQNHKRPLWNKREVSEMTNFWKERWSLPRVKKNKEYLEFSSDKFISETIKEVERYNKLYRKTE